MWSREEAASLARQAVNRLQGLGREQLLTWPDWEWRRTTIRGPSGDRYEISERVGLDNPDDSESLLLVRVRVGRPGIRGCWQRVVETIVVDSDGSVL